MLSPISLRATECSPVVPFVLRLFRAALIYQIFRDSVDFCDPFLPVSSFSIMTTMELAAKDPVIISNAAALVVPGHPDLSCSMGYKCVVEWTQFCSLVSFLLPLPWGRGKSSWI